MERLTGFSEVTTVPQRLRFFGKPLPDGAKLVTRPSRRGSPFKVVEKTQEGHRVVVDPSRAWLLAPEQTAWRVDVRSNLAGFDLACTCPVGWPCHADVLLEIANRQEGS
jgi:hypothetical protein